MADLALGGLERIVKAGLKIKKAVETVHQNKKGCRDVQTCVARVTALLSWLKEGAMMHHPSFTGPLDDLAESMEEALELITDCQQRSALRHLLGARDMAKQLCRVQEDIHNKLTTVMLATNILNLKISVSVTNTLHYVGAHPPLLLPQACVISSLHLGTHCTSSNRVFRCCVNKVLGCWKAEFKYESFNYGWYQVPNLKV
ncbi:unnamed protein product [Miscanthus lutarioriparius]|uniref:MCAfunc domain-containing protein n=1 Tax=Miscanthus lutarioriparius TaxID=422564 RepID=A0A811Q9H1_9POAL|nr:unnamed protein product [Miscanthus lutarioriparius]